MPIHSETPQDNRPSARSAAIALALGSILSVPFMAFHPHFHTRDLAEFVAEVQRSASRNAFIHGSLIVLVGVLVFGFWSLSLRLGLGFAEVRAALVAYVIGAAAEIAAALVSGFIVPDFVSRYADRPPADLPLMRQIQNLAWDTNQVCSRAAVFAISTAMILWSCHFIRQQGLARIVALLGFVAGGLPIVALLSGNLPMNLHGFGAFVLAHAIWCLGVAVLVGKEQEA